MKRLMLLFVVACNTSSDPYSLDHAQILAVRSFPAHGAPGGQVRIDALASDDAGNVFVAIPDRLDAEGLPIERGSDGWYVTSVQGSPLAPTATVTVSIDGTAWTAQKQLAFDGEQPNPSVQAMSVDGAASQAIDVAKGAQPALDVAMAGAGTFSFAWYTSLGKLDHYRRELATFDANEQGDGTIACVVRDGAGGVAWQIVPVHIDD